MLQLFPLAGRKPKPQSGLRASIRKSLDNLPHMKQCSQHKCLLDTGQCTWPVFHLGKLEEQALESVPVRAKEPDHLGNFPGKMQCTLHTHQ